MRRTKGFTLLEIAIALAIGAVIAALLAPVVFEKLNQSKLKASLGQAKTVLQSVELARVKIQSSTIGADGRVTHTYGDMSTWQPISVLKAMLTSTTPIPDTNAFGNPIYVRFDTRRSYVAVDLPYLDTAFDWYPTTTVNGVTRIIVSTRNSVSSNSDWVVQQKRILNSETSR